MPFRRRCMLPRHPPGNPLALHVDLEPTAGRFRLHHRNSPVQLQEPKAERGIRLRMKCRSIGKSQDAPGYVRQRSPVDTTVELLRAARLKKQATMPISEILFAFRGPFFNPSGVALSDRGRCGFNALHILPLSELECVANYFHDQMSNIDSRTSTAAQIDSKKSFSRIR